jgi:hypothetical protein
VRKKVLAVIVAVLAFSLIAASAASLGGINTSDVGADATFVGSCDGDGVTATFSDPVVGASGRYEVASVVIDGIDPECVGQRLSVDVTDTALVSLGSGSVDPITAGPQTVTFATPADAEAITRIAVAISG